MEGGNKSSNGPPIPPSHLSRKTRPGERAQHATHNTAFRTHAQKTTKHARANGTPQEKQERKKEGRKKERSERGWRAGRSNTRASDQRRLTESAHTTNLWTLKCPQFGNTSPHFDGLCFVEAHPVCLWISLKLARGSKDPQPTHLFLNHDVGTPRHVVCSRHSSS